jgi:two-component system, OmpR family, alkaline phosphatase synthesis response regulator PhoP
MENKKILIVDDDPDFAMAIEVILEAKGYKVFSANNKKEAKEKIESVLPDLIIMDVMMERMSDGFDLSREFKSDERYKKIPILMLTAVGEKTGFNFSTVAWDDVWLPVDDYAEKPIKSEELIAKIEKLISK